MLQKENTRGQVRRSAKKKLLFLPHAINQMSRPERMITAREVKQVVEKGEIIEDYPEDNRGHSCLMLVGVKTEGPSMSFVRPKQVI